MQVVSKIPPQLLEIGMRYANKKHHTCENLTEFICNKIINARVLKELNLVSGEVKTIVLRPAWLETMYPDHQGFAGDDGPATVYRIPPEARDNKSISQVMTVQFPFIVAQSPGISAADITSGGYSIVDQVENIVNSYNLANPRNHPMVTLLSGDLVKLTPSQYTRQHWLLTCRINYDETFNNMHDASIRILARLVELATKEWLYVNLYVEADRAVQETGVDINTVKELLSEYKEAGTLYEEEFLKYRGSAAMNPQYRRILTHMAL